jgi:hypothetical protein
MTPEERAEVGRYQQVCEAARQAGIAARADAALLHATLDYEVAVRRLAQLPITEPATVTITDTDGTATEVPNPAIAVDATERATAQAILDAASPETLALVALRNPPVIVEPEVLP